jgi:hypothetical protein
MWPCSNIGEAVFQGNAYWNLDGRGEWDGLASLEEWRRSRGQETLDGMPVGLFADPLLRAPGRGEKLTETATISDLAAYKLQDGSPLIGAGLDLRGRFALDIGSRDFYGRAIPQAGPWCIGPEQHTQGVMSEIVKK